MSEHSFVRVAIEELDKLAVPKRTAVLQGSCQTYPAYTSAAGYLQGVEDAKVVLQELEQRIINNE